MKFENQLHADLFDDFKMIYFSTDLPRECNDIADIQDFLEAELFPQENAPEEFVRYVSDGALYSLQAGGSIFATYINNDEYYKHKIKITVCEEE